jgi:acid phosphatase type 7
MKYRLSIPGGIIPAPGLHLLVYVMTVVSFLSCVEQIDQPSYDERYRPESLLLTWQRDPTTTMTIDWHTMDRDRRHVLHYRRVGDSRWLEVTPASHPFPFSEQRIHRVELTGLVPGTEYQIRFGEDSSVYRFRTLPKNATNPITFAAGGDMKHTKEMMEETNRAVVTYDPEFILIGGDLAYADGREDRINNWYEFLDAYTNTLVTETGRIIPMVVTLGNHEVREGYYHRHSPPPDTDALRESVSPYFYALFAFPGHPGYNVLDFGNYMTIIALDSGHNNPIDGVQTRWLRSILQERSQVPHIFPVYHVPAYPSVRRPTESLNRAVRSNWIPLFEAYGVRVAFENHDHAYKRTYPIRENAVNPDGIVYFGDGAWGVYTRLPQSGHASADDGWYLHTASDNRHFILVTIQGAHQYFRVVGSDGSIIDEYPERPPLITE